MQIVKIYKTIIGDGRLKTKNQTIEEQINLDLRDNPTWTIYLLQHINENYCSVVFNVSNKLKKSISLLESLVKTEDKPEVETTPQINKEGNTA